jgi:hypothetical protein
VSALKQLVNSNLIDEITIILPPVTKNNGDIIDGDIGLIPVNSAIANNFSNNPKPFPVNLQWFSSSEVKQSAPFAVRKIGASTKETEGTIGNSHATICYQHNTSTSLLGPGGKFKLRMLF